MLVVLAGAGLSTDSGLPDYRSQDGLYSRIGPETFHIERFREDPETFWEKRWELVDWLDAEPNAHHRLLAAGLREGRIDAVVTQNVDGLLQKAGAPPEKVIEVHGNARGFVCLACGGLDTLDGACVVAARQARQVPRCRCGEPLKPDVVLFGEPVEMGPALAAVSRASVLLVVGSSLQVHPVAGLVEVAAAAGTQIVIVNREPTPYDHMAKVVRGELDRVLPDVLAFCSNGF